MEDARITVELKPFESGALKAFADVSISSGLGEITLKGFRVVQKPEQDPWVGLPTISYIRAGQTVNKPLLELSATLRRDIVQAILVKFKASNGHTGS